MATKHSAPAKPASRRRPTTSSTSNARNASNASKRASATENATDKDDAHASGGRPLWSGSISFGLLQIPVTLHVAEEKREIAFHQLDRHDKSPIHYKRVNATTGEPVEWKDIVRGYEHKPGEFVIVDDEDLKAANVEATQTVDLADFVDRDAIDATYFERPYYLAPGKRADKAYALFRDALAKKGVAAVGTVVIRTRQHLCALYAEGDVLILELLRFSNELRTPKGLVLPKKNAASEREVAMAEELIESMRSKWEPSKYHDAYHDEVLALIARKVSTGKSVAPAKPTAKRPPPADLLSLLKQSLEAQHAKPGKRAKQEKAAA